MTHRTLLERLRAPDTAPRGETASDATGDLSGLVDSIMGNLRSVLNARANCCLSRPDFGMPDFNDLVGRFPDALGIIAAAVRGQIEMFEPRLSEVSVSHVPDRSNPLHLAFRIHATLVLENGPKRLAFDTVLNNNGYVNVSD
ncbi:type VI secretion system baseplate subunit TssE [Xanthobacter agilis]|uniref:Type VI secretion system protein n=1 Tax=Xanthobacter agilis TaxID=47492 RepID=A0ABU0LEM6_XANAG|nr:type VI secretion system baseplate subunit TssE [Xanthobacter agilis]MDQ0505591.1 type VI secretion system protein [Xanthobacter agilis]